MKHVRDTLDAFVASDEPGVLALKGDWGAGKTYYIKEYFSTKENLPDCPVSYVSLFGLVDEEQVRRRIIPSTVSFKTVRNPRVCDGVQKLLRIFRSLPKVSDFEALFQSIEDFMIKRWIVIFDDIERKGDTLALKHFFGLVNYLSEHAECKVIIVFNEAMLPPKELDEFGKFREKLIDRELLFAPSFEFNARLFFKSPDLFDHALDVFQRCACRNLRVIKRCYAATEEFNSKFKELSHARRMKMLRQVVMLSCVYYQYGGQIDYSQLPKLFEFSIFQDEQEKFRGLEILNMVGFSRSDDDALILNFLETGLFDEGLVSRTVQDHRNDEEQGEIVEEYRVIYHLLNANFQGSPEEFIARMTAFLDKNASRVGWSELIQAGRSLQEFGYKGSVNEWTDEYIVAHAGAFTYEECASYEKNAVSARAMNAIKQRRSSIIEGIAPQDVVQEIVDGRGYNLADIAALDYRTTDFYKDWFLTETDPKFFSILRRFLAVLESDIATEWGAVKEKVCDALCTIADQNKFMHVKVTKILRFDVKAYKASKAVVSEHQRSFAVPDGQGSRFSLTPPSPPPPESSP